LVQVGTGVANQVFVEVPTSMISEYRENPFVRSLHKIPRFKVLPVLSVLISGASAGFFIWSNRISSRTFHSYLFQNNLSGSERTRLLLLLAGGAWAFFCSWILFAALGSRKRSSFTSLLERSAACFAPGILLGFWPFLAVQALEVFYPFQFFALLVVFLIATVLILHVIRAPEGASGRSHLSALQRPLRLFTGGSARRLSIYLLTALIAAYTIFFLVWSLGRHRSFNSYAFDLAWQNQAFYTLLHTGNPRITLYVTLNHLGNHFQPLYYLLAPIYALHQDATTLLVLQTILLSLAALPLYLVAERRLGNPWAALVVALVYLLYPALHGINNFDFHGLALLIPFVCFMLYALETDRLRLFWVFFVLALITREDTAISLSGVGLYLILDRRRRRMGLLVLGVCVGYFLFVLRMMSAFDGYADLQKYTALGVPEQQNFFGVLLTILTNPRFVFHHMFFNPEKIVYLLKILVPVLFLPLFAGKRVLLLLPGLSIILLSNTYYTYWIFCPYTAHLIPYVFFLSIIGMQRIRSRAADVKLSTLAAALLVAGVLMNYEYGLIFSKRFPGFLRPTEREQTAYSFFSQIPAAASLTTTSSLAPHLAARTRIHLFDGNPAETDYILMDLDVPEPAIDPYEQGCPRQHLLAKSYVLSRLESGGYGVVRYEDRFILLEKGADILDNSNVARSIRSLTYRQKPEIIPYYSDPAEDVNPSRCSEADRLQTFLINHSDDTIVLAASGDAVSRLSYLCKKHMMMRGSNIHTLDRGGSYLCVFRDDEVVLELIDNDHPVAIGSCASEALRLLFPRLQVQLGSAGNNPNRRASIRISGREYASDRTGMHSVVLDDRGRVKARAVFCTGR
jgi:uncharacterized membrane protein